MTENAYQALESLGSAQTRDVGYRDSWAMIGVKGADIGTVPEMLAPRYSGYAEVEQSAPAVQLADGFHFYYQDHLGSTRMLDDWESGQADMQVDYYFPFGEISILSGGGEDSRYRFTGQEDDSGIGLHYFKARYYNPGIGRFLTPDPARQQFSPYAYTGNRPLDFVDPDGRFLHKLFGGFFDLFIKPIGDYLGRGGRVPLGSRPIYGSPMVTDVYGTNFGPRLGGPVHSHGPTGLCVCDHIHVDRVRGIGAAFNYDFGRDYALAAEEAFRQGRYGLALLLELNVAAELTYDVLGIYYLVQAGETLIGAITNRLIQDPSLTPAQAARLKKIEEIAHNFDVRKTLSGNLMDEGHIIKIREGTNGLIKHRDALVRSLQNPTLSKATRARIQAAINKANQLIKRAEQLLRNY